jgi:hypothetical protein
MLLDTLLGPYSWASISDQIQKGNGYTMSYFEITAKVEEVNESSYTLKSTGEVITKVQLSLVVPQYARSGAL